MSVHHVLNILLTCLRQIWILTCNYLSIFLHNKFYNNLTLLKISRIVLHLDDWLFVGTDFIINGVKSIIHKKVNMIQKVKMFFFLCVWISILLTETLALIVRIKNLKFCVIYLNNFSVYITTINIRIILAVMFQSLICEMGNLRSRSYSNLLFLLQLE